MTGAVDLTQYDFRDRIGEETSMYLLGFLVYHCTFQRH